MYFDSIVVCPADKFKCTHGLCTWEDSRIFLSIILNLDDCSPTSPCIPLSWKCDGEQDCTDGSDELGCEPECTASQIECTNGRCGYSDDPLCNYGSSCIPLTWKCDGQNDCTDGSDEADCVGNYTLLCVNKF